MMHPVYTILKHCQSSKSPVRMLPCEAKPSYEYTILKSFTSPELVPSSCVRQHTQDVLAQRVLPSKYLIRVSFILFSISLSLVSGVFYCYKLFQLVIKLHNPSIQVCNLTPYLRKSLITLSETKTYTPKKKISSHLLILALKWLSFNI